MPEVKPLKSDSGPTVRQPKAPFRALPANSLHIGPSGSGKSLTLLRTLMDSDKLGGMFDRYEIFSPNIFIDPQYKALIKYIEEKTNQKRDDFCHEEFDQEAIRKLMEEQKKANAWLRKQGAKRLLSACVVIDDFGERADIVKAHGSTLNSLSLGVDTYRFLVTGCFYSGSGWQILRFVLTLTACMCTNSIPVKIWKRSPKNSPRFVEAQTTL